MERQHREQFRTDPSVSSGISAIDHLLPERGFRRGSLSEWIAAEDGSGTLSLALHVAGQVRQQRPLILVDDRQQFYAPAIAATGIPLHHTIVVRPASRVEKLWCVEQSLRCPGVGAVLCRIDALRTAEFRRLQLAAEAGTAVGLLIRPFAALRQPGWADLRLLISPRPSSPNRFSRRLEVRCLYSRGSLNNQTVRLEICDETGAVRVAPGLSDSASAG